MTRAQQLGQQLLIVPDTVRGHIETILVAQRLDVTEIARLEMSVVLFPVSFAFGWFGKVMQSTYGTPFVESVRSHIIEDLGRRVRLLPPHLAFVRDGERLTFCQILGSLGIACDPEDLEGDNCEFGHNWHTFIDVRAVTLDREGRARPDEQFSLDEWLATSFAYSLATDPTSSRASNLAQLSRPMLATLLYETLRHLKTHGLLPSAEI